jgi:hypothetical protein
MRAVVIYESMYGNTHVIAEAVGAGLREHGEVVVVSVQHASEAIEAALPDLLVVGGPTHAHGMTRASTRQGAIDAAAKPEAELNVDPAAPGSGLREWFESLVTRENHLVPEEEERARRWGAALAVGNVRSGQASG